MTLKKMPNSYGIHWFRRDLRVSGNRALLENLKRNQGSVLGLFIVDPVILKRPDFCESRFSFLLNNLASLKKDLGGNLLVVEGDPVEGFKQAFKICEHSPSLVSWSRDYEPYARARDEKVHSYLSQENIEIAVERDHLFIEPFELKKDGGGFYQVFTPFSKQWLNLAEGFKDRIKSKSPDGIKKISIEAPDVLDKYLEKVKSKVELPKPGHDAAIESAKKFKSVLDAYHERRDQLADENGTSHISAYLKFGVITTPQLISTLGLFERTDKAYLRQLIWREFYYHILYHRPDVADQSFLPQYRNIKWENDKKKFQKWCEGKTGFPIVDAAMRQLVNTGWMHNRARMIVASFLTKDLLIDWRWGEKFFMQHLIDGDLAANNGGWQWAASTGCDPQPYFRIFNPYLQSEKFDPSGEYIRRYVPELNSLSDKEIHFPDESSRPKSYLPPIVDHSTQRDLALRMYKKSRT